MKKTLFVPAAFMLLAIAASSCGSQSKASADADSLTFDTAVVKSSVPLTEGSDVPKGELNLQILYAKGPNSGLINDSIAASGIFLRDFYAPKTAPKALPQYVDSFAASYFNVYKRDCSELKKAGASNAACSYEYLVSTSVKKGKDGIINYLANGYSFTGGAHGMSFTKVLNFDPSTGKLIGKDDFFASGSDKKLSAKVVERMLKDFKVKDLAALKELGVFGFSDVYVPNNFILGPDSVTFVYSQDEIAPHALGEIHTSLAYKDLGELLKKTK